jgi:hypothetical protein
LNFQGDYAEVVLAADNQLVQVSLAGTEGVNRNAAAHAAHTESDIIAVDFDPRRGLMYWIDSHQKRIFRQVFGKKFGVFQMPF